MNWKERIRVVSDRLFDLAGLESPGRNQAPYKLDNDIKRVLAHLAASDGTYTRLLRALESGVLRVSAEGSEYLALLQDTSGRVKIDLSTFDESAFLSFPIGCVVATPIWAAKAPTSGDVHTATGTATSSFSLGSAGERCVYVGPMDREVLIYNSEVEGGAEWIVGQFAAGAHDPQYFHTRYRWLDFVNAGAAVDVAVVWWE